MPESHQGEFAPMHRSVSSAARVRVAMSAHGQSLQATATLQELRATVDSEREEFQHVAAVQHELIQKYDKEQKRLEVGQKLQCKFLW